METVSLSFELCWGVDFVCHDPGDGLQTKSESSQHLVSSVLFFPPSRHSRSTRPSCGGACRTHPWWRHSSPARTSSWKLPLVLPLTANWFYSWKGNEKRRMCCVTWVSDVCAPVPVLTLSLTIHRWRRGGCQVEIMHIGQLQGGHDTQEMFLLTC